MEDLADNSKKDKKTAKCKPRGKSFPQGISGNPGGRPKKTPEKRAAEHEADQALVMLQNALPAAAAKVIKILDDPEASAQVKVRILELMLDRTYGKAFQSVKVEEESTNVTGVVLMPQRGDHD